MMGVVLILDGFGNVRILLVPLVRSKVLMKKLHSYGVRGKSGNWFESYLKKAILLSKWYAFKN